MRACRVDANHKEIVEIYRAHGCSVHDASRMGEGFPDLIIGFSGISSLSEVKTASGVLTSAQNEFFKLWRGDKRIVRTDNDVIKHVKQLRQMAKYVKKENWS